MHDRVCCEKQAAAWSVTASVVNYLYFAVKAGVVNGDGCCRKIVDMNTYRVFCILYLKIHGQKYLLQLCLQRSACGDIRQSGQLAYLFCLLSTHADRHVVDISVTVCLSVLCVCVRRIFVRDISGVGWRRAMKFCRLVDIGVHQVISPLVNFGPGVSPLIQKVKNFGNAYLVDRLRDWTEIL